MLWRAPPETATCCHRRQKLGVSHTCRSGVTRYMMLVPGRLQLAMLTDPQALPAWYSARGTYIYSPSVSMPACPYHCTVSHAWDQHCDCSRHIGLQQAKAGACMTSIVSQPPAALGSKAFDFKVCEVDEPERVGMVSYNLPPGW